MRMRECEGCGEDVVHARTNHSSSMRPFESIGNIEIFSIDEIGDEERSVRIAIPYQFDEEMFIAHKCGVTR